MRVSLENDSDHIENKAAPAAPAPPVKRPDNASDSLQPDIIKPVTSPNAAVKKSRKSRPQTDIVENVNTSLNIERVQDAPSDDDIPQDVLDNIDGIISGYCSKYKIDDLRKAPATVWRGACMAVGFQLKKSSFIHDKIKEKKFGGIHYSPSHIAALIPVWAYLCSLYDKAPLAADFIAFSGVSSSWFYNTAGSRQEVTSGGTCVYKKLLTLQESGISSALVDGRRNPTGMIFFLKNWHGWKDSREVVHTDGGSAAPVASYPDFMLPDSQNGSDDGI